MLSGFMGCQNSINQSQNAKATGIEGDSAKTYDFIKQFKEMLTYPANYTMDQAVDDGCYVLDNLTVYGGEKSWEEFLDTSKKGKSSHLRIVEYFDNEYYFIDLLYEKEFYYKFDSSATEYRESKFKHILQVSGSMTNAEKSDTWCILTDDDSLTYREVTGRILSSTHVINEAPVFDLVFIRSEEKE
jgi:hypothetical protein